MKEAMKALIEQSDGYEEILKYWQKMFDALTPCIIINKEGKVMTVVDVIVRGNLLVTKYHGNLDFKEVVEDINKLLNK